MFNRVFGLDGMNLVKRKLRDISKMENQKEIPCYFWVLRDMGVNRGYRILPPFVKHSVKHHKKWATA
jgi:hypothetical protein